MTAPTLLVAGTASHVGKSTVAAGLCRLLATQGYDVEPYKAQNMSNNARAVVTPTGDDFGEIGVSQYVQARAAGVTPTTDHNPVLLKPHGSGKSQLVVQGKAISVNTAGNYYDDYWYDARAAAIESHGRLAERADIVVAEGAGSIAEINLHDRDLANIETARFADAQILLVADIERGGVFASLVGTLELLPDDVREQVVGVVITKFRGSLDILEPGLDAFEDRTGVPIFGVLPYDDPGLPEEDSLALPSTGQQAIFGDDDGIADEHTVTIGVPRLPHISNFTDFDPLAATPGVRVVSLPLDASLENVDGVVLPGSKNTVDDLIALRDAGFENELEAFDGPVVGICGGYQLLGQRIENADVESTHDVTEIDALGYLPTVTRFDPEKQVRAVTVVFDGAGPLEGSSGTVSGYEIHHGTTQLVGDAVPLAGGGAATGRVAGTYIHDLFANDGPREAFIDAVYAHARSTRPQDAVGDDAEANPYEHAASLIRSGIDGQDLLEALGLPTSSQHQ